MSLASVRQLLLVTAQQSIARAEAADEKAVAAKNRLSSAISDAASKKRRDRFEAEMMTAFAETEVAELDTGRAVAALRQFEEDNSLESYSINEDREKRENVDMIDTISRRKKSSSSAV